VLINISGFSRNLRKEISKKSRYLFYDVGVRNAVINQFNPLRMRNDIGQLWENYVLVERLKKQEYFKIWSHNYFWRTYSQQEIDWVEEREGQLFGYEIKWQPPAKIKIPSEWTSTYQNAHFEIIHQDNYLEFIG
jgi:predicted AAA+ superfamily ATPase